VGNGDTWGGQREAEESLRLGMPAGNRRRDFGRCDTVRPKKGLWPATGATAGQGAAQSTSDQEDTGDGGAAFMVTDRRQAIACFLPTNGHV
jgi:hypothetical protein